MNYSATDLWNYLKANWKHLVAGAAGFEAAKYFGAPGSAKAQAILKILGIS